MLTENLSINITPGGVPVIIHISQYDVGMRTFVFSPYTSQGTFAPDLAAAATLEGTKPDGNVIVHNCGYNTGTGEITYTVQEQLAAVAGKVRSKLTLRDTDGNAIGYTAIIWDVDMAGVEDGAIASDSDISALQEFIDEFGTINAYKESLDEVLVSARAMVNIAAFATGEVLTSENFESAFNAALAVSQYLYIPKGDYCVSVEVTQDCHVFVNSGATLYSENGTPVFYVHGCSFELIGGTYYCGEDDGSRLLLSDQRFGLLMGGTIHIVNCHNVHVSGIESPWNKKLGVIQITECYDVMIDNCRIEKPYFAGIYINKHNERVTVRNCTFENCRYSGSNYFCYAVGTGSTDFPESYIPTDGLVYENNYVYDSEDSALDTHGARNVIIRNNTILETVCAISAYIDNNRVKFPNNWVMDNVLIENNYCKSSKKNNPNTQWPHSFVLLGSPNTHTNLEPDYADNQASYFSYKGCTVRDNYFDSSTDRAIVTTNSCARGFIFENNFIYDRLTGGYAIYFSNMMGFIFANNSITQSESSNLSSSRHANVRFARCYGKAYNNFGTVYSADYSTLFYVEGIDTGDINNNLQCSAVKRGSQRYINSNFVEFDNWGLCASELYTGNKTFTATVSGNLITFDEYNPMIPGIRIKFEDNKLATITQPINARSCRFAVGGSTQVENGSHTITLLDATVKTDGYSIAKANSNLTVRETIDTASAVVGTITQGDCFMVAKKASTDANYTNRARVIALIGGTLVSGFVALTNATILDI